MSNISLGVTSHTTTDKQGIQDSIEYNNLVINELIEICRPLFNEIPNITTFEHGRYYKNGTFYYLCTLPEWHAFYLKTYSKNSFILSHIKTIFDERINFHIWDLNHAEHTNNPDYLQFMLSRHEYNLWGGYTIYKHDNESVEYWGFSSNKKITLISIIISKTRITLNAS